MVIVSQVAHVDAETLVIRVSGQYGHGAENIRSGRVVQRAIEEAIAEIDAGATEIVIDYTDAINVGGDGPIWSVGPASSKGLKVRFIASGNAFQQLKTLLSVTRMNQMITLETPSG